MRPRRTGALDVHAEGGVSDHASWGYASDAERAEMACTWLAAGLRRGQRALYVADADRAALVDELAGIPDSAGWFESGALLVLASADAYDLRAPIDADAQLAVYAGAVEQAIADGFDGLCVAADITPLVADVRRRAAHLRWEQVADRYMTEHPLAPLCLHDTRAVAGIDAIVCVHPMQGPSASTFSVHGLDATAAAIAGEVDSLSAGLVGDVLRALPAADRRLDVSGLEFVDARSAWVLQHELHRRRIDGRPLEVTGVSPRLQRVWEACRFDLGLLGV